MKLLKKINFKEEKPLSKNPVVYKVVGDILYVGYYDKDNNIIKSNSQSPIPNEKHYEEDIEYWLKEIK